MSTFTRKLILGERVMYADGASPVNCVFTVSVRGEVKEEKLRFALNTVQAKHPLLQARIVWKRGRPYFEGGNVGKIPVRVLERRSGDDWQKVTEEEWGLSFEAGKGPLARMVWVRQGDKPDERGAETVSELMLICPHCICDGATGVTLMREILLVMDRPEEVIGSYSVFRSVKEMIPRSLLADRGGRIKAYLRSLGLRILFSLRPIRKTGEEGKNYVIRWRLDEGMCGGLIDRCKSENVTVHSAFCVALLGAYKEVKKEESKNKVICPVDIRRYVREIRKDMMFAFAPIAELSVAATGGDGSQGAVVEAGSSGVAGAGAAGFWEQCRQMKEDLAEKIDTIKAYELLLHSEYYHPVAKKLIRWLCSDAGSHDFTFSNMGRLDIPEEYETFSVEAVYSPTVAFPWRNPTTVVVSSFRRQMEFAYVSNSGFLPFGEAMAIRERAMEVLADVTRVIVQPDSPVAGVLPVDLK
jgi:hypothetical protein